LWCFQINKYPIYPYYHVWSHSPTDHKSCSLSFSSNFSSIWITLMIFVFARVSLNEGNDMSSRISDIPNQRILAITPIILIQSERNFWAANDDYILTITKITKQYVKLTIKSNIIRFIQKLKSLEMLIHLDLSSLIRFCNAAFRIKTNWSILWFICKFKNQEITFHLNHDMWRISKQLSNFSWSIFALWS
jgi:hypothetical protein